jgi:hypothetical protein
VVMKWQADSGSLRGPVVEPGPAPIHLDQDGPYVVFNVLLNRSSVRCQDSLAAISL